jgi:hypothetical protein
MARDNINDKNRVRRSFYSVKMGRNMMVDSYQEKLNLLTLEFDDSIAQFMTHPVKTTFLDEKGESREYTADVLTKALRSNETQFIEFKPYKRTLNTAFQIRMGLLNRHFQKKYNSPLIVVTEKNWDENQIRNYQRLYAFKKKPLNDSAYMLLENLESNSFSFFELCQKNSAIGLHSSIPFLLLAHKSIVFDYTQILDQNTTLKVA